MNNLNSVLLEGHLVQDPTQKQIEEASLCTFSLASNRYYKKETVNVQDTSYFQIEVWGKNADNCAKYLKKGSGVRIVGRLKQDRWKDAEDNSRNAVRIVAEHVDFFPKKKVKDVAAASEEAEAEAQASEQAEAIEQATNGEGSEEEETNVSL